MVEPPEMGVRPCMTCGLLFVSTDPERVRRCHRCKKQADEYQPPSAAVRQVEQSIVSQFTVT